MKALAIIAVLVAGPALAADHAPGECAEEQVITGRLACFTDAALAANDPTICLATDEAAVIFNCIGRYGEITQDPDVCGLIPEGHDELSAVAVREACIAGVAVAANQPALCEGLSDDMARACRTLVEERN
ncbi:MAG: hypothetical protein KJO15_01410 [Alphaproteobacteria bacterium]|nr:hypothetical protein [Alphaproteobacteria bacterium]